MNNQREIYEALLAGETLISSVSKDRIKLNDEGGLVWVGSGEECHSSFMIIDIWQIYKEPKWYENIPEGGVLCSGNDDEDKDDVLCVIEEYFGSKRNYKFRDGDLGWKNAIPLTKQEIQVFMDNAPEDL